MGLSFLNKKYRLAYSLLNRVTSLNETIIWVKEVKQLNKLKYNIDSRKYLHEYYKDIKRYGNEIKVLKQQIKFLNKMKG